MKILSIVPEKQTPLSMIFTFRQMESVERLGVENKIFYFPSKNITPLLLVKTYRRIRREIRNYHPDLIHVHLG